MDVAFSDSDITRRLPNILVLKYSQLPENLDEIIASGRSIVVLYELHKNTGHWVLIHTIAPRVVEFFDSYGGMPDTEFCYIRREFRRISGQQTPKILNALQKLQNEGWQIHYNQYRLQKLSPNINTCGRWVVLRDRLSHISTDKFYQFINKMADSKRKSRDQIVTFLVP